MCYVFVNYSIYKDQTIIKKILNTLFFLFFWWEWSQQWVFFHCPTKFFPQTQFVRSGERFMFPLFANLCPSSGIQHPKNSKELFYLFQKFFVDET